MLVTLKSKEFVSGDEFMQFNALHPETRLLLNSWKTINGLGDSLVNNNLASRDVGSMIDRLFMIQRVAEGVFVYKTLGKEITSWVGRDLKDNEISTIFFGPDKVLIRALLESAIHAPGPALARIIAFGAKIGQRTDIEMVFLPLMEKSGVARMLGLFQPVAANVTISRPAIRFSIAELIPPDPRTPRNPGLRLVKK